MGTASETGSVDCIIVAFPGNKFNGEIAPALADLVEAGTIRIIDIAFVGKDADGEVLAFELSDLDPDVQRALNALNPEVEGLFNEEDLMGAAEELEPNMSAALLVWENLWAAKATKAIRDSGGVLLDFQRIPAPVVEEARRWARENAGATV